MSEHTNFRSLREEYNGRELHCSDLDDDPFSQFDEWYQQALDADVKLPDAMSLATCSPEGHPVARTVVLRGHGPDGFRFFTHLNSRKARHLLDRPEASLLFYWKPFHRQVRIEGKTEQVPREEVETYFAKRPRKSQIAAHVSNQRQAVDSRQKLEDDMEELRRRFEGKDVPCPENWGGFRLKPDRFFFWQGRSGRLHDRFRYRKQEGGSWSIDRISP